MLFKSPIPLEELKFNEPVPWQVTVDRELLETTKQKLSLARFPEEQSNFDKEDWSQGAKLARVKELAEYWRDIYSWEKQQVSEIIPTSTSAGT